VYFATASKCELSEIVATTPVIVVSGLPSPEAKTAKLLVDRQPARVADIDDVDRKAAAASMKRRPASPGARKFEPSIEVSLGPCEKDAGLGRGVNHPSDRSAALNITHDGLRVFRMADFTQWQCLQP
jgi:hypothetical protein